MLLGLDTSSYHLAAGLGDWQPSQNPPMRLEHFFRKAAELGLQGVAISDLKLLERADYAYFSSLRRLADDDGLFLQLNYAGYRTDHLQDSIRVAGALGCKIITFIPTLERPVSPQMMHARLDEISALLADALPVAERYGVTLALGSKTLTMDELYHLFQTADNERLSFSLDPTAALRVLEDPLEWATELAPHVSSLQLSDFQIAPTPDGAKLNCCDFGAGIVDIAALVQTVLNEVPHAHLVLATPCETISLPFLDEVYLERLQQLRPVQLAHFFRLLRDRGLAAPPPLPYRADMPEDEILAIEDDRFQASLDWLRGRFDATVPDSD